MLCYTTEQTFVCFAILSHNPTKFHTIVFYYAVVNVLKGVLPVKQEYIEKILPLLQASNDLALLDLILKLLEKSR